MADAPETPQTPPRKTRRIRRYLASFGIALAILLAVGMWFLHSPVARRFATTQVVRLLQQQRIEFSTDELSYNLFELRLSLRNVRIRSQDAPDLPPFASIDRLTADLSLVQLLRRRYVLQSGDAEGVAIHYLVAPDGRDNLPRPPRDPEQPGEPLDYLIEQLRVRRATIRYDHRPQRIDLVLPVSLADVEGHALTDRHTLTFASAAGTFALQDRRIALDALSGEADLGEDDARIERMELAAEGARLGLTGTIGQFADPQIDLVLRGTVDAARASTMARVPEPIGGAFEIDATAKGRLAAPAVNGRFSGRDVSFRNLSGIDLATTAAYDIAQKRATFADLELRAPFGRITGHGVVSLAGSDRSRVTATVTGVDAATLTRTLQLPYVVASRVDAQVQAEWPALEYLAASGNATMTLTPHARASQSVIPVGGRIDVMGRANAIDAVLTRVTAGGAVIGGRVRVVNQRTLEGRAQVHVRDLAHAVSVAEAVMGRPAGTLMPTRLAGSVDAAVQLSGTTTAPAITADVRAPSLVVGSASGLALNGALAYTPARLDVRRLDVQWQQARASATGTIGLGGARPIDLALKADSLQIAELLRAANQTNVAASGVVSLQGRVTGTVTRPAGTMTVNASQLTAYNENWGTLAALITTTGREVTVANLAIEKPQPQGNGRIVGTASYHLDRRVYAVDVRSENVRLVNLTLPDGRPVRGTLQLTARGSGSIDQPTGTLRLVADDLLVDRHAVGRLVADATVANRQATLTASLPAYGTQGRALIGIDRPYPTTATLRIENLQLAALPIELQTPLEGIVRATVDASGNLDTPAQMRVEAVVDAFTGAWNQQPFSVEGPARLRYADERLAIDRLRVVAQDSTVDVQGELPLTERGAPGLVTVDARGNVATLVRYAPAGTKVSGNGDVRVSGTIRGTLRAIDPDLTIAVTNASLMTPEIQPGISNLNLQVRVADGAARIDRLSGNWGEARIAATGLVPLEALPALPVDMPRRGGPVTFTASVQGLNLAQVPGVPGGLTGRVSLTADMSATRADLTALDGRIVFPELRLAFNGLTLDQQQESAIALAGGTATVERFTLTGSVGTLAASGTIGLTGDRPMNLDARGNLNVAVISIFTDAVRAEGETTLNLAARGTLTSPDLTGLVDMRDATFVVDEPTIAAEDVDARLLLSGKRLSVAQLTATLNGGSLTGSGHVEFGAGGLTDAALEVATNDVAFDAPLDLRSLSDARLILRRREDEYVLEGQITLDEGGLTGDINFDEGLLAAMQARRTLDFTEARNPLLERLHFNVNVDTAAPIVVDNNLARAEVNADLRIVGTPYEPGVTGRLTVLEEGEITLNERRYEVEKGLITFIGERRILPSVDLRLNTSVRNYDITIAVTGTPGDTEAVLSSEPALPEPDIMAILATGRTLEEMRGEEFEVAREQVLSYLAGRVGSQLGRGVEKATGLDTVRLEPNLIANEADPTARLTVGEDLSDNLELIYSVNLTDSNDQIWVAEYDVTRRFQTRGVRQSDNSYRFDIRHDLRFGGQPAPARVKRHRPDVSTVSISSDGRISDGELRQWLGFDEGDEFDFFRARNKVEDVEETLEERGYLQSRVRLRRENDSRGVHVILNVTAGPRVVLQFQGVTPPRKVVEDIGTQWRRGVFDTQRIDDSIDVIREWLMSRNHLQPSIEGRVEESTADARRVRFTITPGPRFARVVLAFEGAKGVSADELDKIISEQNLERALFTDPIQVTELLERYYREQGYLVASVDKPRYEFQGPQARIVLTVNEGPRFVVRDVTAAGASVIAPDALVGELPVRSGDPFLPFAAENALQHIRDVYWRRGYNDVRGDYELALDRPAGRVDVRFDVAEGAQTVIADITVEGNDKTSERLVKEQVELLPSQPLDLGALARSRRNLYDTQAFSMVDITREEVAPAASENGDLGSQPAPQAENQKPVRLNVSVREVQPIQLRYGLSYDTERGLGGIFDVSNHNSLGKARVIGFRSRYDGEVRDFRGYMNQPSLRYWPIETIATVYHRDERNPLTTLTNAFNIDRRGASIQQERQLANAYIWNWGMRYERARTYDPRPGAALNEMLTVTPLTTSVTREARDEILDATRGSFSSHAVAYAPSWLGSDQVFIKYFGQYFHYIPLQPERRARFTNEILRPRFVYAGAVRLGIARPFGGELPRSERFFAGGSTTLRGFEQNTVGGIDLDGLPLGGEAFFVVNNELRFPLIGLFDGVVFSDIGNVFRHIGDFSFTDLRKTGGVGLRVRTPWFLIRGDYGVLLDRRDGERRGRFYFSLGQAF